MYVKLFVLGRSGCGKSKTARHLTEFIKSFSWTIKRFKDYDILAQMAEMDTRFLLLDNGFDVLDDTAFDDALQTLDRKVSEHCENIENNQSDTNELVIIEFARHDYNDAFRKLSQKVKQNAYFLLIDADFETCVQRIHKRILSPTSADDHNVSDKAMNRYFREQHLPVDSDITEGERYWEVENQGEWDNFTEKIEPIIKGILKIY